MKESLPMLRSVLAMSAWLAVLSVSTATPTATAQTHPALSPQVPATAALRPAPVQIDPSALPLSHGLFDSVQVYKPSGPVKQFVLLLSDTDGFTTADQHRARQLAATGAMVAGVRTAPFYARLAGESGACTYAAGAFENLSRHIQAYYRVPGYYTPMLVGRGGGGTLAYAVLAQSEPGSFGPTVSIDFCPRTPFDRPMCSARALRAYDPPATGASQPLVASPMGAGSTSEPAPASRPLRPGPALPAPWVVMQPTAPSDCSSAESRRFVDATPGAEWQTLPRAAPEDEITAVLLNTYQQLAPRNTVAVTAVEGLGDLPMIDVPTSAPGNRFAVFLSGDGGWAGIDKEIAAGLAQRGVPVAGFDSLRYFWRKRTPESLAADLARIVRHYRMKWGRSEVILMGFSQGADVLPFAINRLPPDVRHAIKLNVLLSPGQKAAFEFKVSNWLGPSGDVPIAPEAQKLSFTDTLCVHGQQDKEALCPALSPRHAQVLSLPGSHHFDGKNDALAAKILERVP